MDWLVRTLAKFAVTLAKDQHAAAEEKTMKKFFQNSVATFLVIAFALALSINVLAQSKSGIGACFEGADSVGLGGNVKTDFVFESVPFLLELQDTGKTLTAYGKFQGKSDEVNQLGVYEYSYIPFVPCEKKDALVAALKKAYPGFKIKFAGEKSKVDRTKEGAKNVKDGAVDTGKKIWGKLKEKKP